MINDLVTAKGGKDTLGQYYMNVMLISILHCLGQFISVNFGLLASFDCNLDCKSICEA
jgi:hypothetical protein